MHLIKILTLSLLVQLAFIHSVQARDFGWLDDLAVEARADASGVRTRIAARFHIGDARVKAIINDVGGHANAYMVLRLAEMSHLPVDVVIGHYQETRQQGWGVLAKRLGIKPGSREFHALKRGHDLNMPGKSNKAGKPGNKGKGNGQGKGKQGAGKDKGRK